VNAPAETVQLGEATAEDFRAASTGNLDSARAATLDFQRPLDTSLVSEVTLPTRLPTTIGVYDIRRELGRGGMGVVYLANHRVLDRQVALKMVLNATHANAAQLLRFSTEARAVAHLQHPNIVQIFEVGEHEGLPYFSLEYVNGPSLRDWQGAKPIEPREAAQIVEKLARAMQYAHDFQILHRDLKPANVLMTSAGIPKISDFGLAKRLSDDGDSASTRTGTVMGTPSYMSPEQDRGEIKQLTPATDQYSLGAILYELLTGRPPFLAPGPVDTIQQVVHEEPIPPRRTQPRLPIDIETICLKALQKDPNKRYADCSALADDLRHFLAGEPICARPVGNVERLQRWCRRNPKLAALSFTSAASLVAVVVILAASTVTLSR
jgi:serine/threonine-protein kinase